MTNVRRDGDRRSYVAAECVSFDMDSGESPLSMKAPTLMTVQGEQVESAEGLLAALARPVSTRDQIAALRAKPGGLDQAIDESAVRADWPSVQVSAMRASLYVKFDQDVEAREALLNTEDKDIVAVGGDPQWGARPVGNRLEGCNFLGRLLMERREALVLEKPFEPDDRLSLLGRPLDVGGQDVPSSNHRVMVAGSRDLDPAQQREARTWLNEMMTHEMKLNPAVCFEMGDNPAGVDAMALAEARSLGAEYRVWGVGEARVAVEPERFVAVREADDLRGTSRWTARDNLMGDQAEGGGYFLSNGQMSYGNRPTGTVAGFNRMRDHGQEATLVVFERGVGEPSVPPPGREQSRQDSLGGLDL